MAEAIDYDNVVIQKVDGKCAKYPNGRWRVNRFQKPAKHYLDRDQAYQAAIQLLVNAMLEDDPDPMA